jgi:hypothetical protein
MESDRKESSSTTVGVLHSISTPQFLTLQTFTMKVAVILASLVAGASAFGMFTNTFIYGRRCICWSRKLSKYGMFGCAIVNTEQLYGDSCTVPCHFGRWGGTLCENVFLSVHSIYALRCSAVSCFICFSFRVCTKIYWTIHPSHTFLLLIV